MQIAGRIRRRQGMGDAPMIKKAEHYERLPVPWNYPVELEGWWRIDLVMTSTAGGGANWEVCLKEDFEGVITPETIYLEEAKILTTIKTIGEYNPKIAAYIQDPVIFFERREYGYSHLQRHMEYDMKSLFVVQNYKYGFNRFTGGWVVSFEDLKPLETSTTLRDHINEVEKWYSGNEYSNEVVKYGEQGHLELFRISQKPYFELHETKTLRKELFNHQFMGLEIIDVIARHDRAFALVRENDGNYHHRYIVSPDHLDETIILNKDPDNVLYYYIATHPIPTGDDVD